MNTPRRATQVWRATLSVIFAWTVAANMGGCPGSVSTPNDNSGTDDNENVNGGVDNVNDNSDPGDAVAEWNVDFDAAGFGFVSAVWGSGPDDVFVVGGQEQAGEILHYDGTTWQQMTIPDLPRLIWVFGFGADNVYAVGEGGGALHYDGTLWSVLETPTDENLWGVWGNSPTDLWIVGGDTNDLNGPIILNYDGCEFGEEIELPAEENDRNATALFKVWGIGSKVFAVGSDGLIVELDAETREWLQVGTGTDKDFVSLWGTSEDNIVAVGGRTTGQISVYDGASWTTMGIDELDGLSQGLNAVFMVDADQALVGGINGFAATFDPMTGELTIESAGTNDTLHGIWGDGAGLFHIVGGVASTSGNSTGVALIRSIGDPDGLFGFAPQFPSGLTDPAAPTLSFLNDEEDPPLLVADGDDLPFFQGNQGGIHIQPTLRLTGFFNLEGFLTVDHSVVLIAEGRVLTEFEGAFASGSDCAQDGAFQVTKRRFIFDFNVEDEYFAGTLDLEGAEVEITVTATFEDVSATVTRTVVLTFGGQL